MPGFTRKMCMHWVPLYIFITIGPFTKWGFDFTTSYPTSEKGHKYIIMAIGYFTKWDKVVLELSDDGETSFFLSNYVIVRFNILREIVTNHCNHFRKKMMSQLVANLWFY